MIARRLSIASTGWIFAVALPAAAQTPASPAPAAGAAQEGELKIEREVFLYSAEGRRDPFVALGGADMGPRFEELRLDGIIYAPGGGSVVLLRDSGGRIYRARRGDLVGNARVLSIEPLRVVFAVDNFGVVRQESLDLKRKGKEGAAE